MKRFLLFSLVLFSCMVRIHAAVSIRFESPVIEAGAGEEFTAVLIIDGDDSAPGVQPVPNGLFSFAAKIGFDPAFLEATVEGVFVTPQLNYSGFIPGALIELHATNIIIKGNISIESGPSAPFSGAVLAEILLKNRAPAGGKAALSVGPARSRESETSIVDGQGNALDNSVLFHHAEVQVPSGTLPALVLSKTGASSLQITFSPEAGTDHFLEVSPNLIDWTDFQPNAANSGLITIPASPSPRFFRLRLSTR